MLNESQRFSGGHGLRAIDVVKAIVLMGATDTTKAISFVSTRDKVMVTNAEGN